MSWKPKSADICTAIGLEADRGRVVFLPFKRTVVTRNVCLTNFVAYISVAVSTFTGTVLAVSVARQDAACSPFLHSCGLTLQMWYFTNESLFESILYQA